MEYSFQDPDTLVGGIQSGKEEAFGFLFDALYDELVRYVLGLCNDRHTAEDMVQAAFVKLWEKREGLKIHTSIRNYMYSVCHNQFIGQMRMSSKMPSVAIDLYREVFISEEGDHLQREADRKRIREAIEALPEKNREVLTLHKLKGHSYKEVAEMLNISVKTVENHLWKAYGKLRELMER